MEMVLFIAALVGIFALKAFAITRWHEDEVARSVSFSWTKPGVKDAIAVPERVRETVVKPVSSVAWSPTLASKRLRANRMGMRLAH